MLHHSPPQTIAPRQECDGSLEANTQRHLDSGDRLPNQSPTEIQPTMDQSSYDLVRSLTNKSTATGTGTAIDNGTTQEPDLEKAAVQEDGAKLESPNSSDSKDPFLVQWEEGDKENPMNWAMKRKWFLVVFLSWITFLTLVPTHF